MRLHQCSRSGPKKRRLRQGILCFHLFMGISLQLGAILASEIDGMTSNDNESVKSLLGSIWTSFRQKLESTTTTFSSTMHSSTTSSSYTRQEQNSHQTQPQKGEALSTRRIQLVKQTLLEHYTELLVKSSSPYLDSYHLDDAYKQDFSVVQASSSLNRKLLRWEKKVGDIQCYFFSESVDSYWSFQWCSRGRINQGHRTGNDNGFHYKHSLGHYVPWSLTNDVGEDSARLFARQVQSLFPAATVELYHMGDFCVGSGRSSYQTRRMSVVVFHQNNDVSRFCSDLSSGEFAQDFYIGGVEEPRTCRYIFHVCQGLEKDPSETRLREDRNRQVEEITQSDANAINSTIRQIHNVMHAYLHQTSADAYRKSNPDQTASLQAGLPPLPNSRIRANVKLIKQMFTHAYDSYMYNAYPASEIKPITCKPAVFNLVKIPALTLIDSLDTLIVLGNYTEFARSVERLRLLHQHLGGEYGVYGGRGLFALNQNVSVFETNIRILGGLLSAHQLAEAFLSSKVLENEVWSNEKTILIGRYSEPACMPDVVPATKSVSDECSLVSVQECEQTKLEENSCKNVTVKFWKYDGFLLELAQDIAVRLLPAFDTRTGIPYGTVNLLSGIPEGETTIASLAGGGTLSLEMELLSRLTGIPEYGRAAKLAARALWMRRSQHNLLGKHICTHRGDWTESLSGIGSNSDSFYEYLIKHYILFPEDGDFWIQMANVYGGVHNETRLGEWYGDVDLFRGVSSGGSVRRVFEALMAFYPGMQVLLGELTPAARSLNSFFLVREHLGFLPERFNFGMWRVDSNGGKHFLRPELFESAYFLHRATKGFQTQFRRSDKGIFDSSGWLWAADFALHALEKTARTDCGYASMKEVSPTSTGAVDGKPQGFKKVSLLMNEMPSFFLSETLKYFYLTFDENNILHTDQDHEWVFTTEAHPIHYADPMHSDITRKLQEQKKRLLERLKGRIEGKEYLGKSQWQGLHDEKWTDFSQLDSFVQQLDSVNDELTSSSTSRRHLSIDGTRSFESFDMLEPILPHGHVNIASDVLNETGNTRNPAHLTFRRMGFEGTLAKACPNFYLSDFLWIRALNGGTTDYVDVYVSSARDAIDPSESQFYMIGAIDALALQGSGVHVANLFDKSRRCKVFEKRTKTQSSNREAEGQKRKDIFNMGDDLGSFEVSAFSNGSGFYIRQIESGETVIATLIDEATRKDLLGTFVMVYSTMPASYFQASLDKPTERSTNGNMGFETLDGDEKPKRTVVVADLNLNSFLCQIEIFETFPSKLAALAEEAYANSVDPELETAPGKERVVSTYPCAPAMFGPTQMSDLTASGGIVIEAYIQGPEDGNAFGCVDLNDTHEDMEQMPMVVQNDPSRPPNSIPYEVGGEDPHFETEGHDEKSEVTCTNEIVQFVHRGVCTFEEKAMKQRKAFGAEAVVVINSQEDELFVMAGSLDTESIDNDKFPPTILVTGSDGQQILDMVEKFEPNHLSELKIRVSLIRDHARIVEAGNSFAIKENKHWPAVRSSPEALQVFARGGWGVHAVQSTENAKSESPEWQLFLMRHEIQRDDSR